MSVHDLARAASEDLRAHTVADVDAGLDALFATHTRHRRTTRVATAIAVGAAVLAAWWGGVSLAHHPAAVGPTGTKGSAAPAVPLPPQADQGTCRDPALSCVGPRTYRFGLVSPVVWHIPRAFGVDSGGGADSHEVESYWHHASHAGGVSVLEDVHAAATRTEPARADGVAPTAADLVHWLATRPFLTASTPRPTTLDGHRAWQVRVRLPAGASAGPGTCTGRYRCYPITVQGNVVTSGLWSDMVADYTVFDLPGHGTAVVWSWAFGDDTRALATNRRLVAGLSFPGS